MLRLLADGNAHTDVLVATDGDLIVGHAMAADRTASGGPLTEIGVVVADAYRGVGVGSALVRRLLGQAQLRGVTAVVMEVLAENRQVLTMITDHWPVAHQERAGAYITVHAALPPGLRPAEPAPGSPQQRTRPGQRHGRRPRHGRRQRGRERKRRRGGKLYAQATSSSMIFRPGG